MLSLTSEYALRAMTYLAQHVEDWPIPGRRIAEQAGIPRKYLSKVLGDLVRAGILDSSPGIGGGFAMVGSPGDIRLIEVLAPFEPVLTSRRPCPFGREICTDDDPCPGHDRWKRVRDAYSDFLEKTSVADVATNRRDGRPSRQKKRAKR